MSRRRFERLERIEKNVINEQVCLTEEELEKQKEDHKKCEEIMNRLFTADYGL